MDFVSPGKPCVLLDDDDDDDDDDDNNSNYSNFGPFLTEI